MLRLSIVCDGCKEEIGAYNEKAHQIRKRLKELGWVRASSNGVVRYEGPLDYCNKCFEKMRSQAEEQP